MPRDTGESVRLDDVELAYQFAAGGWMLSLEEDVEMQALRDQGLVDLGDRPASWA
jgi:hypothetical protein